MKLNQVKLRAQNKGAYKAYREQLAMDFPAAVPESTLAFSKRHAEETYATEPATMKNRVKKTMEDYNSGSLEKILPDKEGGDGDSDSESNDESTASVDPAKQELHVYAK